jgi:hypothetical protein
MHTPRGTPTDGCRRSSEMLSRMGSPSKSSLSFRLRHIYEDINCVPVWAFSNVHCCTASPLSFWRTVPPCLLLHYLPLFLILQLHPSLHPSRPHSLLPSTSLRPYLRPSLLPCLPRYLTPSHPPSLPHCLHPSLSILKMLVLYPPQIP